ncbi:LysM peptidoglycan-binding domain-containing protein [Trichlorobacter ammonificans]|uniref:Nucleoid-associated protein YgaU, contains BON and LysM domains n=1 Tax=Trichlorobacter ammonificans TaxID=2916410 RepID=A0ABM9D8G2_9BACT|nr:LysM peptidoglycan-binding domain-containing protein [Trichlorobacter ammonificans]CAH2030679.1 Nucleoid-associated protein YgaU, contains BON and LysM domains [Trichlorobacter ammonificans]
MPCGSLAILLAVLLVLAGCTSHVPVWRQKAQQTLAQLEREGVARSHPDDFASVASVFREGERLLTVEEEAMLADERYRLAYQKGIVLKMDAAFYHAQLMEEARQRELQRQAALAEEERRRREAEERQAQQASVDRKDKTAGTRQQAAGHDERPPGPTSYTVRRGETLPQVAARAEIYNDAALWPLIYRANRDQIKDPYQLWPGQVLKIPRGFGKDDAIEARRQAVRRGFEQSVRPLR